MGLGIIAHLRVRNMSLLPFHVATALIQTLSISPLNDRHSLLTDILANDHVPAIRTE